MSRHIAVVTTSYPSATDDVSGHFVQSEVRALLDSGHRVTVLCPGKAETNEPRSDGSIDRLAVLRLGASAAFGWPGVLHRLRRRPWVALEVPGFVRRARRVLAELDCDEVIAHWLLGSGWPIALGSSAPVEVVVHGSDARLLGLLGAPAKRHVLDQLQARGCTLRLVAPHLATLLRTETNAAWLASARVGPLELVVPSLPSKPELRRELGLGSSEFVATIVSRLVSSKRVDVALRRAPIPEGSRVTVVGSGPLQAELQRQFPDVHFLGQLPRDRALRWLKASDVVISASLEEGAPTVLREARSLGVPVWTAEYGSARAWALADPNVHVLDVLSDR